MHFAPCNVYSRTLSRSHDRVLSLHTFTFISRVMPNHAFLDAYIEVNGARLPEFEPTTSHDADGVLTVECWVPSEKGQVRRQHALAYPRSRPLNVPF
jgi:hypothetical protein